MLAGFLALLALAAVGHALAFSAGRRRRQLGVLEAIGFTRRQRRGITLTQGATFALIGVLVGLPLGIAVGRWVWLATAQAVGVGTVQPVPVGQLAAVAAGALVTIAIIGVGLGRLAQPTGAAAALRGE